jgi:hypothetical protein
MESMGAFTEIACKAPAAWAHAVDTFGTEERAFRGMRIPLSELRNRTPEEILMNDPENSEVEAILTRIDYGVFRDGNSPVPLEVLTKRCNRRQAKRGTLESPWSGDALRVRFPCIGMPGGARTHQKHKPASAGLLVLRSSFQSRIAVAVVFET